MVFTVCIPVVSGQESGSATPPAAKHTNRLIRETSPYLLLHAHNPVDWYPWGEEALATAKREKKPIFLSVGYSSCYWCHVMERKVFENEDIAKYMNEHFICIKVDREERPDLDDIYMLSLQVYMQMAGSEQGGGWPLSMFLTPDAKPIAGGTYFPPDDMPGRPGFKNVMRQIHTVWTDNREAVEHTADLIAREVKRLSMPTLKLEKMELSQADVDASVAAVKKSYDSVHGGFDFNARSPNSPKFPVPSKLMLMQKQIGQPGKDDVAAMVDHSLERLMRGGIYDQLGGGFHRYSTDRKWHVPHFEKMLYDNAQLVDIYIDAHRRTNRRQYRQIVEETLTFIAQSMTDQGGGFYSALDAETDGIEGKYYVWSKAELEAVLTPAELQLCSTAFGLDKPNPFEHGFVLHRPEPWDVLARKVGMPFTEFEMRLEQIRTKLLAARVKRPKLLRDDKVLTSWNGLMIRAFARAGQQFQNREYIEQAERAAIFVLSNLKDPVEGHLLRTSRNGKAQLRGYADDYAFLISGLLALHDATGEDKWLSAAKRLTDDQINFFWDRQRGGFFFTMHNHESLIARQKSAYDSVLPSANSVSVRNLIQLAKLTSDQRYRIYAEQTLQAFAGPLKQSPAGLPMFAFALQEYISAFGPPKQSTVAPGGLFTGGVSTPKPEEMKPPKPDPIPSTSPPETTAPGELVVSLQPDSAAVKFDDKIKALGYLSVNQLPAGKSCEVAIEIQVQDGWHINANPPKPKYVIPTALTLKSPDGFTLTDVKYPHGEELTLEGGNGTLTVYEGTIHITGVLNIPASAKGNVELEFQLKYQPCDNINCLRPSKLPIKGKISVAQPGKIIASENGALFNKLRKAAASQPASD